MSGYNSNRNIYRAPRRNSNRLSRSLFGSFDHEFDLLARNLRADFDRAFTRNFASWDPFEYNPNLLHLHEPLFYQPRPVKSFYERQTILNGDDGRTIVKTVKKSPGKPWETYVEEFSNGKSLEQEKKPEALEQNRNQGDTGLEQKQNIQQSIPAPEVERDNDLEIVIDSVQDHTAAKQSASGTEDNEAAVENNKNQRSSSQNIQNEADKNKENDMLNLFDCEFRQLSDALTRKFDPFFARRSLLNAWNFEPIRFNPEHASYRLRTIIDNNGDVTIKSATKDPGSEWQTAMKRYTKDNSIESGKQSETIKQHHHCEIRGNGKLNEGQGNELKTDNVEKFANH